MKDYEYYLSLYYQVTDEYNGESDEPISNDDVKHVQQVVEELNSIPTMNEDEKKIYELCKAILTYVS